MTTGLTPLTEWFYAGQRVKFTALSEKSGYVGYGTVKKVAKKNYQVVIDGKDGWLNVPIATATRWIVKADATAPPAPVKEYAPRPAFGSTVKVGPGMSKVPAGLYIVFGWARDGEYAKLLPLAGSASGKYWVVPNEKIEAVTVRVAEVVE